MFHNSLLRNTSNDSVELELDLDQEAFTQFSNWIDRELDVLRNLHADFEVPNGNCEYFGR